MAESDKKRLILAVDLGTSGCKCALVGLDGVVLKWAFRSFPLHIVDSVGAEQAPEDWWKAFVGAAHELLAGQPENGSEIAAICCSCQGECTVPVDREGRALNQAISWADMRGADAIRRRAGGRLFSIAGYSPLKLSRWLRLTGGAPALSGKDPAGHMAFIQEAMPSVYEKTFKFLNALDYMNLRLTGRFVATVDSILTSWVTDNRDASNIHYDKKLIAQSGIDADKFPEIVECTEVLGPLCTSAAKELGLPQETLVVAGAVDNSAAAIGSGAVQDGDAHLYIGTSSWVGAHVPFKKTDLTAKIASIPCAIPGRYLAFVMQSSAGSNLSNLFDKILFPDDEFGTTRPEDIYAIVERLAATVPPGSRGLLYTPWLFGERSPVEDPNLRAGLLNMSLQHGRADVLRAILEGVALNTHWMMTPFNKFLGQQLERITMVGGGAKSDLWCQIFADILGITVQQVEAPIQANAVGAVFIGAVGIGALTFPDISSLTRLRRSYVPNTSRKAVYEELFANFQMAHRKLAPLYRRMNQRKTESA